MNAQEEAREGGATVLVIDDEADIREMIELALSLDGYRVLTADGGARAIALAREQRIDLVITDLKMPGMNGLETIARLREMVPDAVILVVTGYITPDTMAGCSTVGAREFIRKPFLIHQLEEAVARHLERAQRPRT